MDSKKIASLSFASKAVYYAPDPQTRSINAPIYLSSSFQYDADSYQRVVEGERKAVNIYGRCGNPSEYQFEEQMAVIESAGSCLATSSGMAAIAVTLFGLLKSGDHIVCDWTTYSSTHEMLDHRLTDYGIITSFVDMACIEEVEKAIQPNTKVLYFETIANPSMKVPAIKPLVDLAHSRGIVVVCDNTFASPCLIRPLAWGVDIVVESATKFIGGHNDVIGGVIALKSDLLPADFLETIRWNTMVKWGSNISPFSAWLLLRGIQTLDVRVERQCRTAMTLAHHFEAHSKVRRVWYPGLPSHPQHTIAQQQIPMFGAMMTIEVADEPSALKVLDSLQLCTFAASLGGVRTTTQIPATMAFLDIPAAQRARMNISDGMIRVSVGLEAPADLMADFDQALEQI